MHAQSLSLFDVDASNFPAMKAKFYAFDAAGKQVRPSMSELTITENGITRIITSVSCPTPQPPTAISSVLTVDVSGSMGSGYNSISNITHAKAATRAWIEGLPLGLSECALTSFDDMNYLNQDFTTDRSRLLRAVSAIAPQGGTDYDEGFLQPLAGSLLVSPRGHFKRVIVFLSDGLPNFEPNVSAIIAEANRQKCPIFAVTLGMPCPKSLKEISTQTGGIWYENITTTEEAIDTYRKILQVSQGGTPCEITWTTEIPCVGKKTKVELTWQEQQSQTIYETPALLSSHLEVSPPFISFGKKLPNTDTDKTITLTALGADFTVTGINLLSGSTEFKVVNTNFPMSIAQNTSKTITLRFSPSDSSMQYASFAISTEKCLSYFSATGGFPGKKVKTSTLKLTSPNGGEIYVVGSDTLISWQGLSPRDTVQLEFSADNGTTWDVVIPKTTGLKYPWKNLPKPPSNHCLIRIKQLVNTSDSISSIEIKGRHSDDVWNVAFSPDGEKIATASEDGTIMIWDATTGILIRTIKTKSSLYNVAFSPDGNKIVTVGYDKNATIWDLSTGTQLLTITGHTGSVYGVAFNPDGSTIATASDDGTAKIWDAITGGLIQTLTGHPASVFAVSFSPDGNKIATVSQDETLKIWDSNSGGLLQTIQTGHDERVHRIAFSPDGSKIASASEGNTAKI